MFIEQLFTNPLAFSSTVLIVLISVILHELAHGWAAISQGDRTPNESGHMTLDPVTHMGWAGLIFLLLFGLAWGSMPVNPARFKHRVFSNILVSLAGPLSNLLLSGVFMLLLLISALNFGTQRLLPWQENLFYVFQLGALLNIVLFLFNLLPVPPLDGYHVASAIVPPLKALGENPWVAFIALIVLYNIPGFWSSLYGLAGDILSQSLRFMVSLGHLF